MRYTHFLVDMIRQVLPETPTRTERSTRMLKLGGSQGIRTWFLEIQETHWRALLHENETGLRVDQKLTLAETRSVGRDSPSVSLARPSTSAPACSRASMRAGEMVTPSTRNRDTMPRHSLSLAVHADRPHQYQASGKRMIFSATSSKTILSPRPHPACVHRINVGKQTKTNGSLLVPPMQQILAQSARFQAIKFRKSPKRLRLGLVRLAPHLVEAFCPLLRVAKRHMYRSWEVQPLSPRGTTDELLSQMYDHPGRDLTRALAVAAALVEVPVPIT